MLNNERNGRPILIGTANVKMSEAIVSRLREAGVEPQLLNARPESIARENETISQAGELRWRERSGKLWFWVWTCICIPYRYTERQIERGGESDRERERYACIYIYILDIGTMG